jgi:hypothetical protein
MVLQQNGETDSYPAFLRITNSKNMGQKIGRPCEKDIGYPETGGRTERVLAQTFCQ